MDKKQYKKEGPPETPTPTIVIAGQTASGKSALSMEIARRHNGAVICADSRTVYKGMDIGTAKPPKADQELVPHYGIDLIDPDKSFSAAAFKEYAEMKVSEIHELGKLPIIVGGTGLYIDGYIYDFSFVEPSSDSLRRELSGLSLEDLQARARASGIDESSVDFKNHRHLSRAIERGNITPRRKKMRPNTLIIGLKIDKDVLHGRIDSRVDTMFDNGLIDEVQNLINVYGPDSPGLLAPGYKAVKKYLDGLITLEEAKNEFRRSDKQLAKRQLTWFNRNKDIHWVKNSQEALDLINLHRV